MPILTLAKKIKWFIFNYDWEIVEIEGAIFKVAWGLWLLMPWRTFRTIQGYNAFGNENLWGWGLFLLGAVHLVAIFSGHRLFRRTLTMLAFFFWLFIIVLLFLQSKTSALIPMFTIIAFFMGMNFIRLKAKPDQRVENLGRPNGLPERRKENE